MTTCSTVASGGTGSWGNSATTAADTTSMSSGIGTRNLVVSRCVTTASRTIPLARRTTAANW